MCQNCTEGRDLNLDLQNYSEKPRVYFWDINADSEITTSLSPFTDEYNPELIVPFNGQVPMGVEIEAELADDEDDREDTVYSILYGMHSNLAQKFCASDGSLERQVAIGKEDGSLDYGIEIVTQPLTLRLHREFPYRELTGMGLFAWESHNCGIHVHQPKSAWSNSALWFLLKLHDKFLHTQDGKDVFKRIAGRTANEYNKWTLPSCDESNNSLLGAACSRKSSTRDRYEFINLQNTASIEFRYFRGNINQDGIVRNLEYLQAMYDFCNILAKAPNVVRQEALYNLVDNFVHFILGNIEEYPLAGTYLGSWDEFYRFDYDTNMFNDKISEPVVSGLAQLKEAHWVS